MRLCRIVTVPATLVTLFLEQLAAIMAAGIDLTVVSSDGPELAALRRRLAVRAVVIPMARRPDPAGDLGAVLALTRFFGRERFDIVHSSTPKAGLLTALAAWTARVPTRIHTYTGQVWVERTGISRWVTRAADRVIGRLSTCTYADSASQRAFLVEQGVVAADRIDVVADGSVSGVDLSRFGLETRARWRQPMRQALGFGATDVVVIFVGRVTRDKGVAELVCAFDQLRRRRPDARLLVVGPVEDRGALRRMGIVARMRSDPSIRLVGFSSEPERYLAAADVLCLPSYREGFGSVAIEAAAMGLPCVGTAISGLVDAIVHGQTGILVPPKDAERLGEVLLRVVEDRALGRRLGNAGRRRAMRRFDARRVNRAMVDEYFRLAGSPPPRLSPREMGGLSTR